MRKRRPVILTLWHWSWRYRRRWCFNCNKTWDGWRSKCEESPLLPVFLGGKRRFRVLRLFWTVPSTWATACFASRTGGPSSSPGRHLWIALISSWSCTCVQLYFLLLRPLSLPPPWPRPANPNSFSFRRSSLLPRSSGILASFPGFRLGSSHRTHIPS